MPGYPHLERKVQTIENSFGTKSSDHAKISQLIYILYVHILWPTYEHHPKFSKLAYHNYHIDDAPVPVSYVSCLSRQLNDG